MMAQASDTAVWTSVGTSIVNMGFSCVVAYYLLTKALPDLQRTFSIALVEERKTFMEIEERRSCDSKERSDKLLTSHEKALEKVLQHCERDSMRRDQTIAVMEKSVVDVAEVLEEVRDELRGRNK